jgi:hypothetical protein
VNTFIFGLNDDSKLIDVCIDCSDCVHKQTDIIIGIIFSFFQLIAVNFVHETIEEHVLLVFVFRAMLSNPVRKARTNMDDTVASNTNEQNGVRVRLCSLK